MSFRASSLPAKASAFSSNSVISAGSWDLASIFTSLFILMIFVGITPLMPSEEQILTLSNEGSATRQILFSMILGGLVIAFVRSTARQRSSFPIPVAIAIGFMWVSLTWAIEPSVGFRRVVLTTMVTTGTYLCVQSLGLDRFKKVFATNMAWIMIANIILVQVHPNAINTYDPLDASVGGWKGVHTDKNLAGAIAAVSAMLLFFQFLDTRKRFFLFSAIISIIFLVNTQSKTSTALAPVAILCGLGYRTFYAEPLVRIVVRIGMVVLLASIAIAIYSYWAQILTVLDDPDAFTGRTQIWSGMLLFLSDHWLLGSGAGSFWNIGANGPMITYGGWISDTITVGHNGYLDAFVHLGVFGFAATIFSFVIYPIWSLLAQTDRDYLRANGLTCAIILFCILHNFQETSFYDRDAPIWVFFLFALMMKQPVRITHRIADTGTSASMAANASNKPALHIGQLPNMFRRHAKQADDQSLAEN